MKELYAALVKAQAAIQPVEKSSTNPRFKYKYAAGDDMVASAREALNSAGLALFALKSALEEKPYQWTQYTDDNGNELKEPRVIDDVAMRLSIWFVLAHESGELLNFEPFSVPVLPEKGRPIDKAEAGARTYALSYFLRELLLIPRVSEEQKQGEADPDERDDSKHVPPNRAVPRQAANPVPEPEPTPEEKARAHVKRWLDGAKKRANDLGGYAPTQLGDLLAVLKQEHGVTSWDAVTVEQARTLIGSREKPGPLPSLASLLNAEPRWKRLVASIQKLAQAVQSDFSGQHEAVEEILGVLAQGASGEHLPIADLEAKEAALNALYERLVGAS